MKIRKFIQSILPGIFLFGFTIGTGSVTAMAKDVIYTPDNGGNGGRLIDVTVLRT